MRRIMARSKKLLGGRQSSTVATPSLTEARTPSCSSSTARPYPGRPRAPSSSVALGTSEQGADRAELLARREHVDHEETVEQEGSGLGQLGDDAVEEELAVARCARLGEGEVQERHSLPVDNGGER